jgi:hypothetical protein
MSVFVIPLAQSKTVIHSHNIPAATILHLYNEVAIFHVLVSENFTFNTFHSQSRAKGDYRYFQTRWAPKHLVL